MTEAAGGGRYELERRLIGRSLEDEAFRQKLLEDPKGVVEQELGTQLPEGVQVRTVEETAETIYLVLPSASPLSGEGGELSDRELETVAGGWGMGETSRSYFSCGGCASLAEGCSAGSTSSGRTETGGRFGTSGSSARRRGLSGRVDAPHLVRHPRRSNARVGVSQNSRIVVAGRPKRPGRRRRVTSCRGTLWGR